MKFWLITLLVIASVFCWIGTNYAQNHPELHWQVLSTDHFYVYYHQGLEKMAKEASEIAEKAYGPVTSLYNFRPDGKVHLIINDSEDYSNGAAYYYENKIEIWATNLDYELRGTHHWLRDVITHEFTHIISLQIARKAPRRFPAAYFQVFGYEDEKRQDILTGYPKTIISYPFPGTVVPGWFSEGVSQYQTDGARYDYWDSHRDMILRTAVLNGKILSLDEMGVFTKNGLGNEMVYDHGYSLVSYIADVFGADKLGVIMRAMSALPRLDFNRAIQKAVGISGAELYRRWKVNLEARYKVQIEPIMANLIEGKNLKDGLGPTSAKSRIEKLGKEGYFNSHPSWSPQGDCIAYLSNRGQDYQITSLYLLSLSDLKEKLIAPGATSSLSWSPDGKKLFFARKSKPNRYGSRYWDIYEYDRSTKQEKRLSWGLRARFPVSSPDGKRIAFVQNHSGTNNIGLMSLDGKEIKYITSYDDGTQIYNPQWSPDGKRIVFSISRNDARDIALIDIDSGNIRYLVTSKGDDRDPCWTADGNRIIFASDVTGIFNLYVLSLDTAEIHQLTDVVGGAFAPSVSPKDGRIVFSLYGPNGYELRLLDKIDTGNGKNLALNEFHAVEVDPQPKNHNSLALESKPYTDRFLNFAILPRFVIDDSKPKIGLYAFSSDVLDKQSAVVGALLAANLDLDLYAGYEFKKFLPTFYLDFYKQIRHRKETEIDSSHDFQIFETKYDLSEAVVGARYGWKDAHEISLNFTYDRYSSRVTWSPVSDELRWLIFKPSVTYLNSFDISLNYHYISLSRMLDRDINPQGRNVFFRYSRNFDYLLEGLEEASIIKEKYKKYFYDQFSLDWKEYYGLPWRRHTLGLGLKVDLTDAKVDSFFNFHLGGINQLRGYTYYSISGRKALMGNVTYRFPILQSIDKRLSLLYLDKFYGAIFAEVGKGWNADSDNFKLKNFKRDIGAELRLDSVSYYNFPTAVALDWVYGLDEVAGRNPWKLYFTVLFGYLDSVGRLFR